MEDKNIRTVSLEAERCWPQGLRVTISGPSNPLELISEEGRHEDVEGILCTLRVTEVLVLEELLEVSLLG